MRGVVGLAGLLRSQRWSRDRLEQWQARRLRRLVRHAYASVGWYRRRLDREGVAVEEITGLEDLHRLPIVRREDIQNLPEKDRVASGIDGGHLIRTRTSGSTGVPLEIASRAADRSNFNPSFVRVYLAWGLRPWHRLTYFQARPESLGVHSWYERLGIMRRQVLFSRDDPDVWIEGLRRWRPFLIHGYSLTLKLLAEALRRRGTDDVRVPVVASTSGMLDPAGRRLLAESLQCRVVDIYSSEEAGSVIAWECPRCAGYHVNLDTVILELERNGRQVGPGEVGRVVVTNLSNFTMPLIRYDQGDEARWSFATPLCGRGLPLLQEVCGRAGDYVLLPSGRRLTPHPFFLVLDHTVGVGRWQIVQESRQRLRVTMTLSHGSERETTDAVRSRVLELVNHEIEVAVEVVERIDRSQGWKLRSVVSEVPESEIP